MSYTATTAKAFREKAGSLAKKLAAELGLIETELTAIQGLADGKVIVGNGAGAATDVDLSGDATIANTGAVTITANAVTVAKLAANAVETAKIKDANVTTAKLVANAVTAAKITDAILTGAKAAVVAESNVIGGIPQTFLIPISAAALGDTDITVTHKIRVIDAYHILRGGGVATTTLQVKNAANAITDAMDASGSDTAIVRATTIDDANYEIAAGGTLRVTSATGATQPAALVVVNAVRVA